MELSDKFRITDLGNPKLNADGVQYNMAIKYVNALMILLSALIFVLKLPGAVRVYTNPSPSSGVDRRKWRRRPDCKCAFVSSVVENDANCVVIGRV